MAQIPLEEKPESIAKITQNQQRNWKLRLILYQLPKLFPVMIDIFKLKATEVNNNFLVNKYLCGKKR